MSIPESKLTNASIVIRGPSIGVIPISLANTDCSVKYDTKRGKTDVTIRRPGEGLTRRSYRGRHAFYDGKELYAEPREGDDWIFYNGQAFLNQDDGTNPWRKPLDPWNHERTELHDMGSKQTDLSTVHPPPLSQHLEMHWLNEEVRDLPEDVASQYRNSLLSSLRDIDREISDAAKKQSELDAERPHERMDLG